MDEVEKIEEVEVLCVECNGQFGLVQVPPPTNRLFTPIYYRRIFLKCNVCQKADKVIFHRIKQQQQQ